MGLNMFDMGLPFQLLITFQNKRLYSMILLADFPRELR